MLLLFGLSPGVLSYGPDSDRISSVTHSLPQTTRTQHIIHFPGWFLPVTASQLLISYHCCSTRLAT